MGSFLNVVIYRVPRKESVVKPRSHCPNCDTPIAARDNVPVVSWLVLGGKCRHCGEPISVAVSDRRAADRGAVRRGRREVCALMGASGVPGAHRRAHRDLGDRPRALHHPEPHRVPDRHRERGAAGVRGADRERLELVRPRAARRGRPRSRSSSCCTWSRRAAWASATCGSRSCSACSWGGWAGRTCWAACSRASSTAR